MKDIKGYEGLYKVTIDGRIYSTRSDIFLKLNYKKNGYVYVELNKYGQSKTHRVHRLVAETYIPNPENKEYVHHINNIKSDNNIENLEWVTTSENTKRAYDDGLIVPPNRKIYHIKLKEKIVEELNNYDELILETGYSSSTISTYIRDGVPLRKGKYENHIITSINFND